MVCGAAPRSRPQTKTVTGPLVVSRTAGGGDHVLRYEVEHMPNGDPLLLHPIGLSIGEHLADFALFYTIRAAELEKPAEGRSVVSVERGEVDGDRFV